MGRVVKGAQVTGQAYRLQPPSIAAPAQEFGVAFDGDPIYSELRGAAPAERVASEVDFDALHAEAAQLIDQASADAQALLHDAQERALAIVDEANRQAGEIEAAAKQDGFNQGVSDGRAAAQAEMDEMLETMRGLIGMARIERHKIIEGAEPEIVRLAVTIAERILTQHIALDRNAVVEMVKSAISRLVSRETVTVRVNPADLATMREHREQLMAMNDIDNLRVIEDQRVDRGGVLLETEAGTIDAKVSTQLREVRRLLAVDDPMTVSPSSEPALINPPAQAS
jgi:flagellar assembly protein FliH